MQGGKWYGQHLSTPLKTPHREDDPPIMPPMFYFDLQALCGAGIGRSGMGSEGCGATTWSWAADHAPQQFRR